MQIDDAISLIEQVSGDHILVSRAEPCGRLTVHWMNASLGLALGYQPDELIGSEVAVLDGENPDPDVVSWLKDAYAAQKKFRGTLPYYRKDGSFFWGDLTLSPFHDTQGNCVFWVSVIRDITPDMELRDAFKDAKKEAVTAQQRLWSAIEVLPDAFVLFDAQDRIVMCNERYRNLFETGATILRPGVTFQEIIEEQVRSGYFPEAIGREQEWIRQRTSQFAAPTGPFEQELAGNRFERIHEVRAPTGDTVSLRVDITELKRQQQTVERHVRALSVSIERAHVAAHTDTLTGLANRRGLNRYMRELAARDHAGASIAFLHVDLDRFKQINDTLGHAAGDHVLREVARILKSAVRSGDHVARVGGDEFVLLLVAQDARRVAAEIAERITEACARPIWFEGRVCHYGASVGIAVADDIASIGSLMEDADLALYEAKEQGRGRVAIYSPALRSAAEGDKALADDLHQAVENDEFVLRYQPQVEIATGAIAGIGVRILWRHERRGNLEPEEFWPTAEEIGVASEIDGRIVDGAIAAALRLSQRGFFVPKLSFGADFSRLCELDFHEKLASAGPLPFCLAVELCNSIDVRRDSKRLGWALDALREIHVKIEIDDFGSGRTPLSALPMLAPDRLRVRPGFSRVTQPGQHHVDNAAPILRMIADLADAMEIGLTACGVATVQDADTFHALGFDLMEGDVVAPAMPFEALEDWIAAQGASRVSSSA